MRCCLDRATQPPPAAHGHTTGTWLQLGSSLSINGGLNGSRRLSWASNLRSLLLLGCCCCMGGSGAHSGTRLLCSGGLGGSCLRGGALVGGGSWLGAKLNIHFTQGQLLDGVGGAPDGDVLPNRGAAIGAGGAHKALALPPHNASDAGAQAEVGGGGGALPRLRANLRIAVVGVKRGESAVRTAVLACKAGLLRWVQGWDAGQCLLLSSGLTHILANNLPPTRAF